jgi:hypothetical protein
MYIAKYRSKPKAVIYLLFDNNSIMEYDLGSREQELIITNNIIGSKYISIDVCSNLKDYDKESLSLAVGDTTGIC